MSYADVKSRPLLEAGARAELREEPDRRNQRDQTDHRNSEEPLQATRVHVPLPGLLARAEHPLHVEQSRDQRVDVLAR